jgi:deoxyribose-phosphate aldolase
MDDGADEVDAVINLSAVAEKDWTYLKNEMDSLVQITHLYGKSIKLILETAIHDRETIAKLCELAQHAGADFVKTSTGFAGGADVQTVAFMRSILPAEVKIKASGGIRDTAGAIELVQAGAVRLGTSKALTLIG